MKDKSRPDPRQVALEWGLPDWQNARQYPDHEAVGINRWCWEFLRRSDQYRTFWRDEILPLLQRRAALPQEVERRIAGQMDEQEARALSLEILDRFPEPAIMERLAGGQTPAGPMPDECLPGGGTRFGMAEAMRQFGLFYAIDPRKSERVQPVFAAGVTELHAGVVDRDPHKVAVELDTRLPDKQQLDKFKRILSGRRHMLQLQSLPEQQQRDMLNGFLSGKRRMLKLPSPGARTHVELYADYLRVLDAKESGATDLNIARVLFPERSTSEGMQQVKNFHRAARKLRDGGWRQLLPGK